MIAFDGSSVWNRAAYTPGTGVTARKTQTWSFDDAGNWSSTVLDGTTQNRTHNVKDQITNFAGNATTHDARGNLLTFEHNSKDYDIEYDVENRMTKVEVDTQDVEYRYDAFGRRTIRKEGSDEIALLWWGNSECAEVEHGAGQPTVQNDIFCDPNRLNAVIARAKDGSKFDIEWYHKNYLDHVYAVSDDTGDLIEHYRYTAYGEQEVYNQSGNLISGSAIGNEITWNTRRCDELTGFYMYQFRHYIAVLGKWGSRDPIGERGGVNLYSFVGNDAINKWDKLGLKKKKCCIVYAIVGHCSHDFMTNAIKRSHNPIYDSKTVSFGIYTCSSKDKYSEVSQRVRFKYSNLSLYPWKVPVAEFGRVKDIFGNTIAITVEPPNEKMRTFKKEIDSEAEAISKLDECKKTGVRVIWLFERHKEPAYLHENADPVPHFSRKWLREFWPHVTQRNTYKID